MSFQLVRFADRLHVETHPNRAFLPYPAWLCKGDWMEEAKTDGHTKRSKRTPYLMMYSGAS